jgi:hypothetical protein
VLALSEAQTETALALCWRIADLPAVGELVAATVPSGQVASVGASAR